MSVRAIAASAMLLLGLSSPAAATGIVYNGDFGQGNTFFGSAYAYTPGNCWMAASYDIVASPGDCHGLWSAFADHTGNGAMMVINGSTTAGKEVWTEWAKVTPYTQYYFQAWVASTYDINPAQLTFSINGVALGSTLTPPTSTGVWRLFYVPWNSGSSTSAAFALVNKNMAWGGNDFAIDDIDLTTTPPGGLSANPEPASLTLLATGLIGTGAFLRRRSRKRHGRS